MERPAGLLFLHLLSDARAAAANKYAGTDRAARRTGSESVRTVLFAERTLRERAVTPMSLSGKRRLSPRWGMCSGRFDDANGEFVAALQFSVL